VHSLNLNVEIDPDSGFCFGVINAIEKAEKNLEENAEEIYCLGEIVHNDEEIKRLGSKGLKVISRDDLHKLQDKRILFRAHGEPPSSYETAGKNNNHIIDASCPIILRIQKRLKKSYNNNENIYIFGKSNHPEIIGLNGQIDNKAIIFEGIEQLDISNMPEEITLYSQTTKSLEEFKEIVKFLVDAGIQVKVEDTICRQVANRKFKLINFCQKFDKVVFVAGKHSSNGKVLFDICKSANSNTYFLSSVEELKKEWFAPNENVGISGATSTPMWLMNDVKNHLVSL
jgi:4-hydroxy-3-methylbut-2-en-1-yl diphosphate reductase